MKALVTGGGGFLGRYIVEQLVARGDQVRSYSRGEYPGLVELGVETLRGDMRDRDSVMEACRDCDVVFHTAALPGIWGKWETYHEINTLGTHYVVEGCRAHQVPRLVFSSSPSVTFDGTDQKGVDESAPYPTKWLCHYPHSKALAEQHVLAANDVSLATCALRPHLIWGPRDGHLVPRLIERARSGQLRRVGNGKNLVDMIYVENAAEAHLQAADALEQHDSAARGKAYFISQGEPVNCWGWINDLLSLVDEPPITRSISQSAAARVGSVMESVYSLFRWQAEPRMTCFLAAQLATDHYFDISAAQRDFGYQPSVSTDEGMRRLREWLNHESVG